ncbi:MAG: GNAT family N-acetyltransferase [Actinobacteria bacterium]|nr:GNAT family N-acetyltransferase [Actinomycetota bacterium]
MEVRPARVEDAAALAEIHVRTWQAAYEHVFGAERLATIDLERRVGQWQRWLAEPQPHWRVFAAAEDERVVGFSWLGESRTAADEGELYAIYVLPESWGSGPGPALMAATLEALREDGFRGALLWVLEDNPRARRFYEREGWTTDGTRREEEFLGVEVAEVRYRITL